MIIEFKDGATESLKEISGRLNISESDVIRHALSLYRYAVYEQTDNKKRLALLNKDSEIDKIVEIPGVPDYLRP